MRKATLISTYDLGRQPFALASAAAWLEDAGISVRCVDTALDRLEEDWVRGADLVAFSIPMHTATRLAARLLPMVRQLNPTAHICAFGLYGPINEAHLRKLGVNTILGGEFEEALVALALSLPLSMPLSSAGNPPSGSGQPAPLISLGRQKFKVPLRTGLPKLERYAKLITASGAEVPAGSSETTRGCKHLCRHCPIVPIYGGRFRVVQKEIVLEDVRQQIAAGAAHITFGDPDFFNGPSHGIAIVAALHREFPELTYDVTIKVEHLLRHARLLPVLRETGCLFVTSAFEAVDERTLEKLQKHHTREDIFQAVDLLRTVGLGAGLGEGLGLNPTFVPFTPWTSLESYLDFLAVVVELDLVEQIAPIQYAIRLLITASSHLLPLEDIQAVIAPFDEDLLIHPWKHPDPRVDRLSDDVMDAVNDGLSREESRPEIFARVVRAARSALGGGDGEPAPGKIAAAAVVPLPDPSHLPVFTPRISEPWYC